MSYRYKTTPAFRKALANLSPAEKGSARRAFAIFKDDPFDARLHAHKIHALSARFGRTMYWGRGRAKKQLQNENWGGLTGQCLIP